MRFYVTLLNYGSSMIRNRTAEITITEEITYIPVSNAKKLLHFLQGLSSWAVKQAIYCPAHAEMLGFRPLELKLSEIKGKSLLSSTNPCAGNAAGKYASQPPQSKLRELHPKGFRSLQRSTGPFVHHSLRLFCAGDAENANQPGVSVEPRSLTDWQS